MKTKKWTSLVGLILSCIALIQTTPAHAESAKLDGNIAVHIAKTYYLHPTRFLHPYLNVWQMQGPIAEKAAMPALKKRFSHVTECSNDSEADVVLLLEPHVFYNAQLRVYYTEFIARAYTQDLSPITRIKEQAIQSGALSYTPDADVAQGYTKAIDQVIDQLVIDKAFLTALNKNSPIKAAKLCQQLDNIPFDSLYY